jgi:hypothetical protein
MTSDHKLIIRRNADGLCISVKLPTTAMPELADQFLTINPAAIQVQSDTPGLLRARPAVEAFLLAKCERTERGVETAHDLFVAYNLWAAAAGWPPLSPKAFGNALVALGCSRMKSCRVLYAGVRLMR